MDASLQEILANSKAPTKNGVQVIQVEKRVTKSPKIVPTASPADLKSNLTTLLKEQNITGLEDALTKSGNLLEEDNVVDFLLQLPSAVDKSTIEAIKDSKAYGQYIAKVQDCVYLDSLSDEMKSMLFLHTLVLNTTMDKARFLASLYRKIENFDLLSLLEVIGLYLQLDLSTDLHKKLPYIIPSYNSLLHWASLLLDAGLVKIMGHRKEYEEALTKLKGIVEESIKQKERENILKSRLYAIGINKTISLPSVAQSDIVLETIYL